MSSAVVLPVATFAVLERLLHPARRPAQQLLVQIRLERLAVRAGSRDVSSSARRAPGVVRTERRDQEVLESGRQAVGLGNVGEVLTPMLCGLRSNTASLRYGVNPSLL